MSFDDTGAYIDLLDGTCAASAEDPAKHAADWEEGHFWFEERARLVSSMLAAHFPEASSLLEVGCGSGGVLQRIVKQSPKLAVSGGDTSAAALVRARRRLPSTPLYRMDAECVPFDAEFDVVCCLDVLEHVGDDLAALRSMHRAARPEGGLVVTVPQYPRLWSEHDVRSGHVRRYTSAELREKVEESGWRILRSTSFVFLLFPLMVASRTVMRRFGIRTRCGELAPPWPINALLRSAMRLERSLIEAGMCFPFGGSGLVVARKVA